MITLIDYGAGNLHSLEGALARLGLASRRAATPDQAPDSGILLLPGVGHFGAAMGALKASGWAKELPRLAAAGRPLLGICLGLHLLAEGSEESPQNEGLGLLPGVVRRLGPGVKVPHMGWSPLRAAAPHPALPGADGAWLYFVHSYALEPSPHTLCDAFHGRPFAALEGRGKVLGFQPHPEKSGPAGLRLLRAILAWMDPEVPCP